MLALKVDVGFLIEKIFPISVLPFVNGLVTYEFQEEKMIFTCVRPFYWHLRAFVFYFVCIFFLLFINYSFYYCSNFDIIDKSCHFYS